MAAEKAKAAVGEAKVKKQLVAREQEIAAVQARMQASYREHVKEVQQLQGKVGSGTGALGVGGTWWLGCRKLGLSNWTEVLHFMLIRKVR